MPAKVGNPDRVNGEFMATKEVKYGNNYNLKNQVVLQT